MRREAVILLTIMAIAFAVYAPNLRNGLFWDDQDWVSNNSYVHAFSLDNIKFIFSHDVLAGIGLKSNYYRPFLFLTFMLNYSIGGITPFFYHLFNNLIHIANGALIFFILYVFLKNKLASFLAALFFLIHPLQTEAVAYISGRGDPLSVFLMLLALVFFLTGSNKWPGDPRTKKSWFHLCLSFLFMILAVLSRETAFLFPLYLMVFLVAFVYKENFFAALKRSFFSALPYFSISLAYGILRLTVLNFQNTLDFYRQPNFYTEHLNYRIYTFLHVLIVYLRLIFVPTGLHMERGVVVNSSFFQWPVWFSFFIFAGIFIFIIYLYKTGKENDLAHFRIWFFAWAVFLINLVPTSGIIPINGLLYEHWLYFSLFGFSILLSFYLAKIINFLRQKNSAAFWVLIIFLTAYFTFFSVQSVKRNIVWGKPKEFYADILKYESDNVRALANLGNIYSDEGNLGKAEELYWKAINVDDVQPVPYYNLGNLLRDRGDTAGAIELYKKAIEKDASFPFAYLNLAALFAQDGLLKDALFYLQKLQEIEPENPTLYYNIAQLKFAAGRKDEALAELEKGLKYAQGKNDLEKAFNEFIQRIKQR